ncbi:MAG: hypothetical protein BGO90_11405 [Legionella sp. 40-6]|nr:hypothetical protein [Legionella sp.]OJY37183.1 MAG: hypothetical protein BGO90_11405 [Legionella sp. 40-6]
MAVQLNTMTRNQEAWLSQQLENKKGQIVFASPSDKDFEPNSPINVSRFGFKTPQDLVNFLKSPAGDTVKGEISTQLIVENDIAEANKQAILEHLRRQNILRAMMLMWLMDKRSHAQQRVREFIEMQNQQLLQQNTPSRAHTPNTRVEHLQNRISNLDAAIREYETTFEALKETEAELDSQLEAIKEQEELFVDKEEVYSRNLVDMEQELDALDTLSEEELNLKIEELENQIHAQTSEVMTALELDDEMGAKKLLHAQTALNFKLANLLDLRATRANQKFLFDEEGNPVPSAKQAKFVLEPNQKVIKQDDKFYLLKENQDINQLSMEEKLLAEQAFKKSEPSILVVKNTVTLSLKAEKEFHNFDKKREDITNAKEINSTQQRELQNSIRTMQSAREEMRLTLEKVATGELKLQEVLPKNNPANFPTAPISALKFLDSIPLMPKNFFYTNFAKKVDEFAQDENNKGNKIDPREIKDYFKKALRLLGLGTIPSLSPLPETTMKSLLENMPRFGANSYKPQVTPLPSPMETTSPLKAPLDSQTPAFNPTPTKTTPTPY